MLRLFGCSKKGSLINISYASFILLEIPIIATPLAFISLALAMLSSEVVSLGLIIIT